MKIWQLLFGKRLKSEEEQNEQLSTVSAIPVVGLDALASAAYGPEAALTVLLVLGNLGSKYITPISGCIKPEPHRHHNSSSLLRVRVDWLP